MFYFAFSFRIGWNSRIRTIDHFAHRGRMAPLPVGLTLGLCWPLHKVPNIARECYHIVKVETISTCSSINWATRMTTANRHTGWELTRPIVILLTNPHRRANQTKARITLIYNCVSVSIIFSNDLPIHNEFWNSTVTR